MKATRLIAIFMAIHMETIAFGKTFNAPHHQSNNMENLGKAVEYFQSGKYHEALLLFEKIGKEYKLNVRFLAYTGVCYFYDSEYEKASKVFDDVLDKTKVFAPHERSVYYYCAAKSNYHIQNYSKAVAQFEKYTLLCYDNEKGDALMRIGLCHRAMGNIPTAQEYLVEAMAYYQKYNTTERLESAEREIERINKEQ